jgi:hypothetical protein
MQSLPNIGTAKSPINLGRGRFAYKRDGRWHHRQRGRFRFVEVTDSELALELERRGYEIINPGHECVDRPHLPCPACENARALKTLFFPRPRN